MSATSPPAASRDPSSVARGALGPKFHPNCGGGVAQEVLDVRLPASVATKVGASPNSPRLEEASSICLLKCDRKASVPCVEEANLPPVARCRNLRVFFRHSVSGRAKPLDGFLPPTAEGFDGEWNQAPPWQRPGRVAAVFPVCCSGSGGPIHIGCGVEPRTALRMSDHDVPVDEGVVRRAEEAAVQARLLHNPLTPRIGLRPGPRGLQHLRGAHIAGGPPDPSESVPERMVSADDQAADPARQRVEAVSVQRLRALPALAAGGSLLCWVSAALVAAAGPRAAAAEGDAEPHA